MNTGPKTDHPVPPAATEMAAGVRRRRNGLLLLGAASVALVMVMALALALTSNRKSGLIWYTPAELTSAWAPGPLSQLKYQLVRIAMPIWRHFQGARAQIDIKSEILLIDPVTAKYLMPNAARSTNVDGTRVWVLSGSELAAVKGDLKSTLIEPLMQPGVTGSDGMRFQVVVTQGGAPTATNPVHACTLDLLPRLVRRSVQLTMRAVTTETQPNNNSSLKTTNLCAACRAMIPNGGGLVLASGGTNDSGNGNYWLIISPTALDSRGKPR